ncbi:MAG: hypothetical protein OXC81_02180 [Betaproteobacteria bacterium]|nr:hypothetical protein [Betaproteobacteria bacterium]
MKRALVAALLAVAGTGCTAPASVSAVQGEALENYFPKLVEVNFVPGFDLDAWPLGDGEDSGGREARVAQALAKEVAGKVRQEIAGERPAYLLVVIQQVQASAKAEGNSGVVTASLAGEVVFFDIENEQTIARIPVAVRQQEHYLRNVPLLTESGKLADELANEVLAGLFVAFAEQVGEWID